MELLFAILNLSGNMPAFVTWLITRVKDLMIVGSIICNNLEEMLSNPILFFVGRSFIVFLTVSSLTFLNLRTNLTCVFK